MESILQTLISLGESLVQIDQIFTTLLGFSPLLIVPVCFLTFLLRNGIHFVLDKFDKRIMKEYKNLVIGLIVMSVGMGIILLTQDFASVYIYIRRGLMLGSISAISYQICKPVLKKLVKLFPRILMKKFGLDNKEES